MTMVSSADDCKQLVAGNYDVIINESSTASKQTLLDFLELFQHHEQQLGQPDDAYANEFRLLKELSKALKENKANLEIGELDSNQRKNRYKDIIPFSHTRVILQKQPQQQQNGNQDDGCYINANYVRGPSGLQQAYIACQGPLPCTLKDFWRMIWECSVSVVVMACNEFESGKPKCELYWPDHVGASQNYGNIQVTLLRVRQINSDFLIRKFSVKLLEPISEQPDSEHSFQTNHDRNNNQDALSRNQAAPKPCTEQIQVNIQQPMLISKTSFVDSSPVSDRSSNTTASGHTINYTHDSNMQSGTSCESINTTSDRTSTSTQTKNSTSSESKGAPLAHNSGKTRAILAERTICQFHYTTWPDHGVPDSVSPILELVRLVREVQPTEDKPILVHCSAGCGRTGTICCIDYVWGLLRMGKLDEQFNLCRIIGEMRQQRMAMVQTLEQYILCHRAVAALFIQHLQQIDNDQDLGPVFI